MHTELRRARLPQEPRSLVLFDHKAFAPYPADWFDREDWKTYDPWWLIVNRRKVGCCAFASYGNFQEELGKAARVLVLRSTLSRPASSLPGGGSASAPC